jgi:hypothetical protein
MYTCMFKIECCYNVFVIELHSTGTLSYLTLILHDELKYVCFVRVRFIIVIVQFKVTVSSRLHVCEKCCLLECGAM